MLLERPKDEVALLSVFLLLRIPLFEPVSFEIVPGEYANRLRARTDRTVRVGRVMETVKVARFFALLYVAQRVRHVR